jgi:phospholipid/cholesterol/gamma-HCH transport system ATP-binding protein
VITYRDIHKSFDAPVLSGVDMMVETGEMFALFGPSGTGKSVLLKTTIGLIVPDRGDVEVDGLSVYESDLAALLKLRSKVGYVFQHSALFDSLTVLDNVAMGLPEETLQRLSTAEKVRRVWGALETVNLEPAEVLSKIPSELSGGMKKRCWPLKLEHKPQTCFTMHSAGRPALP